VLAVAAEDWLASAPSGLGAGVVGACDWPAPEDQWADDCVGTASCGPTVGSRIGRIGGRELGPSPRSDARACA